jgi:hypothetical protein
MEKRKAVEQFPAFPQSRLRLLAELRGDQSKCKCNAVQTYFAPFGIRFWHNIFDSSRFKSI